MQIWKTMFFESNKTVKTPISENFKIWNKHYYNILRKKKYCLEFDVWHFFKNLLELNVD